MENRKDKEKEKNNKEVMKSKRNMKKTLAIASAVFLLLVGSGFAIWQFILTESVEISVGSEGTPLVAVIAFADMSLNASMSDVEENSTLTLKNTNEDIEVIFTALETRTDVVDDCVDYEADVSLLYTFDGTPITNSDIFVVSPDTHDIVVNAKALQHSCPQSVESVIALTSTT